MGQERFADVVQRFTSGYADSTPSASAEVVRQWQEELDRNYRRLKNLSEMTLSPREPRTGQTPREEIHRTNKSRLYRYASTRLPVSRAFRPGAWALYLAPLAALAWLEEWGWDRFLWHERPGLFPGAEMSPGPEVLALVVPLLALPQATHYVLDGWVWRARGNPRLGEHLGF